MTGNHPSRDRISHAVCAALEPFSEVLAGWESGSAAFNALDAYSDIDLNFLITDEASLDMLYAAVESALAIISPITAIHASPPGRYYKLKESDEFLLVDVCFFRVGAPDHSLDVERHGHALPLFDKGEWLHPRSLDRDALAVKRRARLVDLQTWFPISQSFVRKAILRGHHTEALASFWGSTLKPLVELLRMRHCPDRWDFGLRYLDRDLPENISREVEDLAFVCDLGDLIAKLERAEAWGMVLLRELEAEPPNGGGAQ